MPRNLNCEINDGGAAPQRRHSPAQLGVSPSRCPIGDAVALKPTNWPLAAFRLVFAALGLAFACFLAASGLRQSYLQAYVLNAGGKSADGVRRDLMSVLAGWSASGRLWNFARTPYQPAIAAM